MIEPSPKFSYSPTDSLNKAWYAVTSNLGPMIGFTILYYIATTLLGYIPIISGLTSLFQFVYAVSLFSAFDSIDQTGKATLNDFFKWTPKFGKLLGAHLIIIGIAIIVFSPLIIFLFAMLGGEIISSIWATGWHATSLENFPVGLFIGALVFVFIGGILLAIATFAFMFLMQFRDLPVITALKLSIRVGRENAGSIIIYAFLALGVTILGLLALLIGLLVAIPVVIGMQYYLLRSVFPAEEIARWDFMAGEKEGL